MIAAIISQSNHPQHAHDTPKLVLSAFWCCDVIVKQFIQGYFERIET